MYRRTEKEVIPDAVDQLAVYKSRLWCIFQFEFNASGFLNDKDFEIFEALQDFETIARFFSSVRTARDSSMKEFLDVSFFLSAHF